MDIKIESATFLDIDDICKIIYNRCVWFSDNELKGWQIDFYPNKYNKEYFIEQMKINKLFVAKSNNKVCGVMLLKNKDLDYWKDEENSYYVHHLATDTNFKGVGRKLIDYAKEECKLNNKKYLRLDCYKESIFLNNYYKNIGFNNVGSGSSEDYNYNLWEMEIK